MLIGTPTSATSRDGEMDVQVMEPPTQEQVSATLVERIEERTPSPTTSATATHSSKSMSVSSQTKQQEVSTNESQQGHSPASAFTVLSSPNHRLSDPSKPGWGFDSPSSIHRVSSPPVPSPNLSKTRDTFALLQQKTQSRTRVYPRGPSISSSGFEDLPFPAMLKLASLLDHQSYLAARLTCQSWYIALTHVRPPIYPPSLRLPTEIVQTIYKCLDDPRDFDAARHTCRSWMTASLESWLLERMFRKGGWWASWVAEMARRKHTARCDLEKDDVDEIWAMSRALSRECALAGPAATTWAPSHYADLGTEQLDGFHDDDGNVYAVAPGPFDLTLETDFSELSDAYTWVFSIGVWNRADPGNCYGLRFTPSVCGRFVMAVDGYRIYVYRLGRDPSPASGSQPHSSQRTEPLSSTQAALHPVSSIICPRRVLAVSMDSSAGRHAVAALMDDRMGLVCDLAAAGTTNSNSPDLREPKESGASINDGLQGEDAYWSAYPVTTPYAPMPRYHQASPASIFFGIDSPASNFFGNDSSDVSTQNEQYRSIGNPSIYSSARPRPIHSSIPCESGPRTVYRAIGAADDPPLSVAICPQRRCVAFGCAAGIELHWIDALTGHDLQRWFPLAAPSDFLFFLPPSLGVDGSRKLRLVSSARLPDSLPSAGPSIASATAGVPEGRHDRARAAADTFRAIPFSDGTHVVFTDPATGSLCVGKDAPSGLPCRLSRKVVLESPTYASASVYAVGRDLQWGARVVAAYGNELWLYTVPADVLLCEEDGLAEAWADTYASAGSRASGSGSPSSSHASAPATSTKRSCPMTASVWPLHVRGTHVATVPQLAELAIDSRQATLTIWAFARDGMVRAWQVRRAEPRTVRAGAVRRDGSISGPEELQQTQLQKAWTWSGEGSRFDFERDEDGDAIMLDAPLLRPPPPPPRDLGIFEPRLHPFLRRQLNFDGSHSPVTDTSVLDARCQSLGGMAAAAAEEGPPSDNNRIGADNGVSCAPSLYTPSTVGARRSAVRARLKLANGPGRSLAPASAFSSDRERASQPRRVHQCLPELFSEDEDEESSEGEDDEPSDEHSAKRGPFIGFVSSGATSNSATHVPPSHARPSARMRTGVAAAGGAVPVTAQTGHSSVGSDEGNVPNHCQHGSDETHRPHSEAVSEQNDVRDGSVAATWDLRRLDVEVTAV